MRKSSARASHLVLLGPAARPQATPGRSGHPLPTFGPPAPVKLKDYNSRQALRSRCCGFIDQALHGLMGVGVLSASPGCREDGNFFGGGGAVMRCRGPKALQGRGIMSGTSRSRGVRSPEGPWSGKPSPRPGDRWARLGCTQVFRDPPFQNHVPLPGDSLETLQHSHSRVGDPRTSAPTRAPMRPGRPPGWGCSSLHCYMSISF